VKLEPLQQKARYRVGAWQQDACLWGEARVELSLSPERGREGQIREVPEEDHCSSMYSNYMHLLSCIFEYLRVVLLPLHLGKPICTINCCLFFAG
jgi:hypothetical protein